MIDFPRSLAFGQVSITPAAEQALEIAGVLLGELLFRHGCGDWGNVSDAGRAANIDAVENGEGVLSGYRLKTGVVVLIYTEADRSATTVFLSGEYQP